MAEPAPASLDYEVRLFVYRFMVDNERPPMPVEIAGALRATSAEVEAALKRLAEVHVLVLAPVRPTSGWRTHCPRCPHPFP